MNYPSHNRHKTHAQLHRRSRSLCSRAPRELERDAPRQPRPVPVHDMDEHRHRVVSHARRLLSRRCPPKAAWPYIVASGLVHIVYNVSLVRSYRRGDLAQAYPIARGSSPLLVTLGAALFAHEAIGPLHAFGIVMISGGIMALALQGGRVSRAGVLAALTTGRDHRDLYGDRRHRRAFLRRPGARLHRVDVPVLLADAGALRREARARGAVDAGQGQRRWPSARRSPAAWCRSRRTAS